MTESRHDKVIRKSNKEMKGRKRGSQVRGVCLFSRKVKYTTIQYIFIR